MPENGKPVAGALLGLHAQTALHPGAGTALGTVDLPVQRERHTHWPNIAGSALKGILRDAVREKLKDKHEDEYEEKHQDGEVKPQLKRSRRQVANEDDTNLVALFGPGKVDESSAHAGALSITDARLLAFPVRSLKGVFAWVTCPAVLERFLRDAEVAGKKVSWEVPTVAAEKVMVPGKDNCPCLIESKHVVLEEFEFERIDGDVAAVAESIALKLLPATASYEATRKRFQKQLLVLSDDDFTHFARHATEVSARVGLNYETKTVKPGALFYQEFLPTETLFYAVVLANPARSRNGAGKDGPGILKELQDHLPPVLQVGGDETTGKGLCAVRLF